MTQSKAKLFKAFIVIITSLLLWSFIVFTLKLASPPPPFTLAIEMSSSGPSLAQLFYDVGRGFNESDSRTLPVVVNSSRSYQTLVYVLPYGVVSHLRFDPLAGEGTVTLRHALITGPRGVAVKIAPVSITSFNQIKSRIQHNDDVTFRTIPGANDPGLLLDLAKPIDCRKPIKTYLSLLVLNGLLLSLMIYVFDRQVLRLSSIWEVEIGRAALVLIGLLHICFFPAIWGDRTMLESAQDAPSVLSSAAWSSQTEKKITFYKVLDPGAPAWAAEPLLGLIRNIYYWEKAAPLWDPYQALGTPLAANMQSQPFSPLTMLLLLHLTPRTYSLFIFARLLIAGLGLFMFLRYFVSFTPALCGAIVTALGGYYMVYITMPHLSVEMWLPTGLFAGEYMLRRVSYGAVIGLIGVVFLVIVGGMPESAALLLTFVYLYLLFRIVTDRELRLSWWRHIVALGAAAIAGMLLACFLLLPFIEYVGNSFNTHEQQHTGVVSGLIETPLNLGVITYVFPLLFGTPTTPVFGGTTGIVNYFGMIPLFTVLVAVSMIVTRKKKDRELILTTLFFSFAALLIELKRFGFRPINIIGALPIFNLIIFPKYSEPLLTVSIAVLCAVGIEYIRRRSVPNSRIEKALCLAFLVLPITLIQSKAVLTRILTTDHGDARFIATALGVPTFLFFLTMLTVLHYNEVEATGIRKRLAAGLVILIAAELCLNFVVPEYRVFGGLPYQSENPYAGAPFISFLKSRTRQQERIFGRDLMLHPDWASVFQLCDIRDLDAIYYRKYFPFLHNFVPEPPVNVNEFNDRFTGGGEYNFSSLGERRLLQLSSVKYLISRRPFVSFEEFVKNLLSQNAGKLEPGKEALVRRVDLTLDGIGRAALLEHPPYKRLPYKLAVPRGTENILTFWYAIDPAVWNGPGDGVTFQLELQDAKDKIHQVFTSYIDPKHNQADRHWVEGTVNLNPYQGQTVRMLLTTGAGPRDDTADDWAAWAGFKFANRSPAPDDLPFKQVYAKESLIYEFSDVLPRAALYFNAETPRGEDAVLKRLANPSLDVFSNVVLDASQMDSAQLRAIRSLNSGTGAARVQAAWIRKYESRDVEITSQADRSAVLVLNDSDYPGWSAWVDGKQERIISANYLFRGVLLSPGKHIIRFTYNPASFRIGETISLITLLTLVAGWFISRRKRRSTHGNGLRRAAALEH